MITVTDSALREMVKDVLENNNAALGGPKSDHDAVNVNAVVDPQASDSDPMNDNMSPQTKAELQSMIQTAIRDLPDEKLNGVFKAVKDSTAANDSDASKASKSSSASGSSKVEEAIRQTVRNILNEIRAQDPADVQADEEEQQIAADIEKRQRRGKYKPSSTDYDADTSFGDVASEFNMAVSGAKQLVDKALLKVQFTQNMDPRELRFLTLHAINDYISLLKSSDELDAEDVKFLEMNPEAITELDGFRVFLHDYIAKTREKAAEKREEPGYETEWAFDNEKGGERDRVAMAGAKRVLRSTNDKGQIADGGD